MFVNIILTALINEDIPCIHRPMDCKVRSRTLHTCGFASAMPDNFIDIKNDRRKEALRKGQLGQYAQPYMELGKVQPCSLLFVQNIGPYLSSNVRSFKIPAYKNVF